MMTVGDRIKERRTQLGLSQQELANRLGLKSRAAVCTVENNREDLTLDRLVRYAQALQVSPSFLMGWDANESDEVNIVNIHTDIDMYEAKFLAEYRKLSNESKNKLWDRMMELQILEGVEK